MKRITWDVGPGAEERFARAASRYRPWPGKPSTAVRGSRVWCVAAGAAGWLLVATGLSLLVGRIIRYRDRQRPPAVSTDPEPAPLLGVVQPRGPVL